MHLTEAVLILETLIRSCDDKLAVLRRRSPYDARSAAFHAGQRQRFRRELVDTKLRLALAA